MPCEALSFWQPFWLFPQTLVDFNFFSIEKALNLLLFRLVCIRTHGDIIYRMIMSKHPSSHHLSLPDPWPPSAFQECSPAFPSAPSEEPPAHLGHQHLSSLLFVVVSATLNVPKQEQHHRVFPTFHFYGRIPPAYFCNLLLLHNIVVKFVYVLGG